MQILTVWMHVCVCIEGCVYVCLSAGVCVCVCVVDVVKLYMYVHLHRYT